MLEALFIEIVGAVLFERGRQGLGKFFSESPAQRAIDLTASDFPNIPVVDDALTRWCKSDDFAAQFDALQTGREHDADDSLIDSFINVGGFYDGINNTHTRARRVLEAFFKHFEEELYKTDFGPLIEAQRAKIRHRATQAGIQSLSQQVQQQTTHIEEVIRKAFDERVPSFGAESSPAAREKVYFDNIDLAVELLKEGKAKSARTRLEALRTKLAGEDVSTDLRFRLTANLGSCALQLNDFKTAQSEYEAALAIKPEHRLVLSYAALAAMLNGDGNRALEYARRSVPAEENRSHVLSTYIRVLHSTGHDDDIQRLLQAEAWVEQDPACALSLGLIRLERREYDQAENHFRVTLQGDAKNAHAHHLLAQAIITPVDMEISDNPPTRLSAEALARIDEAESHITRAVEIFETYENPSPLHEALLQRAYIRGLQGQTFLSLVDCDRLLAADPGNAEALRQKGHTLLFAGKIDEAIQCFAAIEDEGERRAATLAAALAHHRRGQHDRVIELLAGQWRPAEGSRQQSILADLLLAAYYHTGKAEQATALVNEMERERPEDSEVLVVIARHHLREGRNQEALDRYMSAVESAALGNQRDRIRLELAECHFEMGRWGDAVEHYRDVVDPSPDNPEARNFLLSLYNSGARREALKLAETLRDGGEAMPFVSEVEARVLAASDEYEAALGLFTQLAQREPGKISHRLWVVEMQRRLNHYEEAREALSEITLEEVKDDPETLIRVADLRQKLDMGGDMPFAYRARRVGFNDADVHHAYVQLFMNHTARERGDLDVRGVAVDFAVHLADRHGEKKVYVIVEQDEYDLQHGEIPPTDPRAVALLGLHTGDRVTFNEGRPDEVEYEIVDIQSKYVYAFQQTIIRHTEWFGGSDKMMVMNVADGDFSKFLRMIDRSQDHRAEVAEMYEERRIPLATLARAAGNNLFETWASIVQNSGTRLYATSGDLAGMERAGKALSVTEEIVVEMSSLLTLRYLGLLDKLPKTFRRAIVARQTVDKLERWLAELERQSPYMTMWKERDQYFRTEITEEILKRRREFLSQIRSFLASHAEVVPAVKALDIPDEEMREYEEVLGESACGSLFVASELGLPLYLDDMGLSTIAGDQRWQVQGVSTPLVLVRMRSRGLISAVEHYAALKSLLLGNYAFIPVTSEALWWMCMDEGKKATISVRRILLATIGPDCVEEPALTIGTDLIRRVWLEVRDPEEKIKLVDLVIYALAAGRDAARVKSRLKEMLPGAFRYLPRALPQVLGRIDAFDLAPELERPELSRAAAREEEVGGEN